MVDHLLVPIQIQLFQIRIIAFDLETEAGGEIFLVTDHHIHILCDLLINFLRLGKAADRTPHGRPVVQVIRDDRPVFLSRLDCRKHRLTGLLGQCRIDAARMQPAHAQLPEDMLKIEILRCRLGDRRICTVRTSHCTTDTKTTLRKVQPIPAGPADPVGLHPLDQRSIHTTLQNKVFHQHTDLIVRKCRDHTCLQSEASPEAPDNIVLSAALPGPETPGRPDSSLARIQAQHYLAQRYRIISAFLFWS